MRSMKIQHYSNEQFLEDFGKMDWSGVVGCNNVDGMK